MSSEQHRILVVDDEPTVIRLIQRVLGQRLPDADVVVTQTGELAIEALKGGGFDMVIVDKNLPGIDGLGVVAWMRANGQQTPALLVSAFLTPESREVAQTLGVVACFCKPFSVLELCSAVALALGHTLYEPPQGTPRPALPPPDSDAGEAAQNILVVDDDFAVQKYLRHVLVRAGHTVTVAGSVEEATSCLKSVRATLAFVDVNLPSVSGLNLVRTLRELHPDVRVILMTATPEWLHGEQRGADAFLEKPFPSIPALLDTVRRVKGPRS